MVCYCPERKILYIHLPKCAGLTIESILIKQYNFKHFTFPDSKDQYKFLRDPRGKIGIFKYILKYSNESKIYDLTSFRKFTIVRNPYKKAESAIRYLHKTNIKHSIDRENKTIRKSLFPMGIDFFYRFSLINDYYYMHFCLSQSKCLEDLNGNIDFTIGKFENLMPELRRILFDEYGFEPFDIERIHVNKSVKELLTFDVDNVNSLIATIHLDDFKNFGYDLNNVNSTNEIDETNNTTIESYSIDDDEKFRTIKNITKKYNFVDEFDETNETMDVHNFQVQKISSDV